jgi:hypothetical protein
MRGRSDWPTNLTSTRLAVACLVGADLNRARLGRADLGEADLRVAFYHARLGCVIAACLDSPSITGLRRQIRRRSSVRGCSRDRCTFGSRIGPGVCPNGKNRDRRRASASFALTGSVS